ncbi:enoyl-CoA hydratase/isomerase family protein [Guptibacillus spartinae]|uniref:enoyl-CoA hydratase/isomerase family protein n=1 Tax=Guptibacillus spartinae TaxID=3025679 RepID=UPI0023618F8B|nr:enoyl-CoA hydratase/isomerase family protein [Pseudalkalibacillus spartinae]
MCIEARKEEKTIYLSMDYPEKKNGLDLKMATSLLEHIRLANQDTNINAIVFESKHRAFFSSGPRPEDLLTCVGEDGSENLVEVLDILNQCVLSIFRSPKVTVALINGYAYGGGFNIMLACDRRISLRRAKFLENFHQMGMSPDLGASYLLPRIMGVEKTFEILINGELIQPEQALQLGLVHELADNKKELHELLNQYLKKVSEGYSPAIAATKKLLKERAAIELESQMKIESSYLLDLFKHEEIKDRLKVLV